MGQLTLVQLVRQHAGIGWRGAVEKVTEIIFTLLRLLLHIVQHTTTQPITGGVHTARPVA